MPVMSINIAKHISCVECGRSLAGQINVGEIREHADRVYSFVCQWCKSGGSHA